MTTRTNTNSNRIRFYDQADKNAELNRLDQLISWWGEPKRSGRYRKSVRFAIARRRKVSGWVVGI